MLANTECLNRYTKSRLYGNEGIDNHSIRIPWLNFLTAQSIPEETDVMDCPKRNHSDSDYSTSSLEDFYVVLEVQRPRSIDETTNITEEELNFAQINEDEHHVEYEQFAQSIIIEEPLKEYAKVTQLSNNIFHTSKRSDKSISIFNDNSFLKTNYKLDESHSLSISSTISKQQSFDSECSITSLDSIENYSTTNSSIKTRITTTFSHLSSQQYTLNPIQTQQEKSIIEKTTLTHTFAFDRASMEKYSQNQDYIKTNINSSKTSSFIRSIKKHTRIVKSEYYLSNNEIKSNEPSLLQVKYLDGRPTLIDINARESFRKSQILTNNSISSRLDSSKIPSTQNLSYRKRILNYFQTFLKPTSTEQSRPWQHKTIFELINERKNKTNRH